MNNHKHRATAVAVTAFMALLIASAAIPARVFARENIPVTIDVNITYIVDGNVSTAGGDKFTLTADDPRAPMPEGSEGGKKTIAISDEGSYTIHDSSGNEDGSGGGVAYDGLLNHERPLTADEMAEEIANRITLDERDGKYILYWHDKKVDVTNVFGEDGYAYLTLVDGSDTLYVTINKDGSYSTSPDRYMVPGKDFETN